MQFINNQYSGLLEKEMDRRGFLKHVGIGLVALTGASALLGALNNAGAPGRQTSGYGSANYGGVRPKQ